MDTKDIIVKIEGALKKSCEQTGIDKKDIRLRLSLKKAIIGNSVICEFMDKTAIRKNKDGKSEVVDLKSLLGLNSFEMIVVSKFLCNALEKMCKSIESCNESEIDARICTRTDDYYPSVFLFNKNKFVREITVKELIS